MANPKITIEKENIDSIIELIGIISIFLLIGVPMYYYSSLPEIIPIHFDGSGQADDFGRKAMIWLLPIIGLLTYIGIAYINNKPHTFNYAVKITAENAERQYRIAMKFIRILNTIIAGVFAYLTYSSIQVALENQNGLSSYFLPLFLIILFVPMGFALYKSVKEK